MAQRPQRPKPAPGEADPESQFDVLESGVTDLYCDVIHFGTGLWGTTFYLGDLRPGKKPILRARIKISPQMLKAVSLLAAKQVQMYEHKFGPIHLPADLVGLWSIEEDTP